MGGEKCGHLLQQYPLQALLHGRQLRFEHVRGDELREHLPAADGGGWGCSLLLARAALFLVLLLLSPPASLLGSLLSPPSSPGSAHPVEAKCGEQQADCAAKQQAMQRRGLTVQCASGGGGGGGEGGRVHAAAVSRSRGHDGGGAEGGVGSCMCKVREPEKASRRRPSQQQCCRCVAAGLRSVRPSGATISTQKRWEMRRQHTERNGH